MIIYDGKTLGGFVKKLKEVIIANSVSDKWEEAVLEWQPVDLEYDPDVDSTCVCGHPKLFYLYRIRNELNGKELFPIGSSCIQRFERKELTAKIVSFESVINIYKAMMGWEPIEFTSKYFTRGLIDHMYERGAFKPTAFNDFNPKNDYIFSKRIFNKKEKHMIPDWDWLKMDAIMKHCILPFIKKEGEKSLVSLKDNEKVDLKKYIKKSFKYSFIPYDEEDRKDIIAYNVAYGSKTPLSMSEISDKIKAKKKTKPAEEKKKLEIEVNKLQDRQETVTEIETKIINPKKPTRFESVLAGHSSISKRRKTITFDVYVTKKIDDE